MQNMHTVRSSRNYNKLAMVTLSPPRTAVPEGGTSDGSSSEHVPMITSTTSSGGGGGGGSVRRLCLSPRKRALAAAAVIVAVAGVGIALSGLQQDPFGQCDRQCRAAYGFYDRSITGARRGALGDSCACSRAGEPLGEEQPWRSHTPWNESFWCDDFSTALVCVAAAEGERTPRTMSRADAELAGRTVLHCGACAACSTLHDLQVLNSSKEYATLRITKCATAYAKPKWLGGHRDVAKLRTCMREAEVGFSEDGAAAWAQPADQATCMDCWTGARHRRPRPHRDTRRRHRRFSSLLSLLPRPSSTRTPPSRPRPPRRQHRMRRGGVRHQPGLHPPLLRPGGHRVLGLHQVRRDQLRPRLHPLRRRQPPLERNPLGHHAARPAGLPRRLLVSQVTGLASC